ncbi:L-rhamnose/proton symporter RhaT [Gaoshiqia sp. Z1-71]|uniref:L-rhamnose/proton symporter RhaT n=1 Tax=Gaoshiqia hydrogeniformans TaxID=3290090 RepID=UPI003BF7C961
MVQLLGIFFHWIGGLSSASFYIPTYSMKRWAWHTSWITLGMVAWVIMPWVGGWLTTHDLFGILVNSDMSSLFWTYLFGVLWGFGGLMAGLGLRYLGIALGQSISLGVSAVVGTLVPALIDNKAGMLISTLSGRVILVGFIIGIAGIVFGGYAGVLKDRKLNKGGNTPSGSEFSVVKGLAVAVIGGVLSAFMAFAIKAGQPLAQEALRGGTEEVYMNNPIFVLAFAGGFTTNFVYTMILSLRKKSFGDFSFRPRSTLFRNYLLATASGVMWYGQFFFYGMGSTKMGQYDFTSWSIHMSSIIIFSNLWGLWLKEWHMADKRTLASLWASIILLILSVLMIGLGNYLAG